MTVGKMTLNLLMPNMCWKLWVSYLLTSGDFFSWKLFFHEIAFYSLGANVENVKKLLVETIKQMAKVDWTDVIKKNKVNIEKSSRVFSKNLSNHIFAFCGELFFNFQVFWLVNSLNQPIKSLPNGTS